jgi:hypothetical protein
MMNLLWVEKKKKKKVEKKKGEREKKGAREKKNQLFFGINQTTSSLLQPCRFFAFVLTKVQDKVATSLSKFSSF